jgi:uncharacterized RDD family membrane protein YckC/Tfp pilus assembly major pilin PilA
MRCASCGNEALPGQQFCVQCRGERTGSAQAGETYANFWRRAGAAIVDYLIVSFGTGVLMAILAPALGFNIAFPVLLLVIVLYYVAFESSPLQATPGKLALSIKVTDVEGERIGIGRSFGRYIGKFVSGLTLGIGYLMAFFTSHRQALHDKIASTLVVRKELEPAQIAKAGPAPPVSAGSAIVLVIAVILFGISIVGMLAAISIPAYQDYTIRSQVIAGFNEANQLKTAVDEAHAGGKDFSEITTESIPATGPPVSPYVESIDVVNGAIVITYGGQSNVKLREKVLVLVPATTEAGAVSWVCGRANAPPDATLTLEDAAQYTTVDNKYLPRLCRAN